MTRMSETDTALSCRGLVKRYGSVVAVDGLFLEVRRGECLAARPERGGQDDDGRDLRGAQPAGRRRGLRPRRGSARRRLSLRARLGIQLQETKFPEKLRVEVIALFRSFYPRGRSVSETLALVQLQEKADALVKSLSTAARSSASLGCALVGDPELLFLDEPTTGSTPVAPADLGHREGLMARGRTVLLIMHYMEEAARLCHRVAIVDHGRLIALGTPPELVASLGAEHVIEFAVEDGAPAPDSQALRALPSVEGMTAEDGRFRLTVREVHRTVPALLSALAEQNAAVSHLTTHHATLKNVFVAKTGRTLRDA
jgi:ABC-2 type transport system ATP-binding protein